MGAFEEFVESDLFFPILIGMLLLLITVFVVILISDKKHERIGHKSTVNTQLTIFPSKETTAISKKYHATYQQFLNFIQNRYCRQSKL